MLQLLSPYFCQLSHDILDDDEEEDEAEEEKEEDDDHDGLCASP